jgi:hypothetical protein
VIAAGDALFLRTISESAIIFLASLFSPSHPLEITTFTSCFPNLLNDPLKWR